MRMFMAPGHTTLLTIDFDQPKELVSWVRELSDALFEFIGHAPNPAAIQRYARQIAPEVNATIQELGLEESLKRVYAANPLPEVPANLDPGITLAQTLHALLSSSAVYVLIPSADRDYVIRNLRLFEEYWRAYNLLQVVLRGQNLREAEEHRNLFPPYHFPDGLESAENPDPNPEQT